MSNFIHASEWLDEGDVVVVACSHQCNVRLMSDSDFSNYRAGRGHDYYGGFFRMLPARIVVPSSGHWNVVIDLGGGRAGIRYKISYLKRSAA